MNYNPVVRTFGKVRAAIIRSTGVSRNLVRSDTPLESLLPESSRAEVWRRLRQSGLKPPELRLSKSLSWFFLLAPIIASTVLAMLMADWFPFVCIVPLWILGFHYAQRLATCIPSSVETVGDLTLYLTRLPDHPASEYRWSQKEIERKVRMIVAETTGYRLSQVQPHHSFIEDLKMD